MPLYELIVIAKVNNSRHTTNLLKSIAQKILESNGNVRDLKVLGDRVLAGEAKGNDG